MRTEAAAGPSPTVGFCLGYRPELDGLRGIAILAVMLYHLPVSAACRPAGGFLGVDLFFVLSGFLITTLLLSERQRTGSISLRRFYLRRLLRLMPALAAMVLAGSVCAAFLLSGSEKGKILPAALAALSYQTNWLLVFDNSYVGDFLSHTWSLSVEEHFYLLWPILLAALVARTPKPRRLILLLLTGIATSAVLRFVLCRNLNHTFRACVCLDTRADALLAGCLVGVLASFRLLPERPAGRALLHGAALLALGLVGYLLIEGEAWIVALILGLFTVVAIAFAVILAALLCRPPRAVAALLRAPPLTWVGRISYGLYLWHVPVGVFLPAGRLGVGPGVAAGVQLAASFALAAVSFYGLELPFLRLKRHCGSANAPREAGSVFPGAAACPPTLRAG